MLLQKSTLPPPTFDGKKAAEVVVMDESAFALREVQHDLRGGFLQVVGWLPPRRSYLSELTIDVSSYSSCYLGTLGR